MSKEKRFYLLLPVVSLVVFLIILSLIEVTCFSMLKANKKTYFPLFYAKATKSVTDALGYGVEYHNIDPHLGYALIPAFKEYGNQNQTIKIFTLGGSTTDPYIQPKNWSYALAELCKQNHVDCVVYNGGVGGYTTSQELLKLIRDVRPLKPDVVISLNGVNDLMGNKKSGVSNTGSSMVHSYQAFLMNYLARPQFQVKGLFPNTQYVVSSLIYKAHERTGSQGIGISYGTKDGLSPVEVWHENVRMMNAIANEFGFKYLEVLQPVMGFGSYELSSTEKEMWTKAQEIFGNDYSSLVHDFYTPAKQICSETSYCLDLTDAFKNEKEIYTDSRHPNEHGHTVEANAIFTYLQNKNLLNLTSLKK